MSLMFPKPVRNQKPRKPLKPSRKAIQRKSKFHAQDNPTKLYHSKRSLGGNKAFAASARMGRLANPTEAELAFASILRDCAVEFEREKIIYYAKGLRFLILDFYCEKANIAFEVDGPSHTQQRGYDRGRDRWLEASGIRTIRFTNSQVLRDPHGCAAKIIEAIG